MADEGRILVALDFSQIELRVLAHDADEKVLIEAFLQGRDIHSTTASVISGLSYEEIQRTKDDHGTAGWQARNDAKTVNFGIVYGMTASGLSKNLNTTKENAQKIIDEYFAGYPGIKGYMDSKMREANTMHYVEDMYGRVRNFHNPMNSGDKWRKLSAGRQAGNFPIQSAAGIILKKAIVALEPVLKKWDSHIVLQVHDELIFDCPKDIPKEGLLEIQDTMQSAEKLVVPLVSDIDIYPERWAQKVSIEEWYGKE